MILIYSDKITPRLEYIIGLIFTGILKTEVEITSDKAFFIHSDLPKINYSEARFDTELFIKSHGLLQHNTIEKPDLKPFVADGEHFIFSTSEDSFLPFDAFATSFYLVTRFEEYLNSQKDRFGRFRFEDSIATQMNWLKNPVVNIWADRIAAKISEKYPETHFPERKPKFISTIDVDNAWAYLHKGFWRTYASLLKALIKGKSREFSERIRVLKGNLKDPYDTYGFLKKVFADHENETQFFFLTGKFGKYDKNISPKNSHFKHLVNTISSGFKIGIHPSFASASEKSARILIQEKKRLEKISGKRITQSRQHYIRINFPETYQKLLKAGINKDYSMGYSNQTGFRAGICTPFAFYDLSAEKVTELIIVPFQVMDVTLADYMDLSPDEAWEETEKLMHKVKNCGGTFVSVWHNESLNNHGKWKGYRDVFEKMNQTGFSWNS